MLFQSSVAQISGQRGRGVAKAWTDQVKKYLLENLCRGGERERERERWRDRGEEREVDRERQGGRERVNNVLCYGGSAEVIKGRS